MRFVHVHYILLCFIWPAYACITGTGFNIHTEPQCLVSFVMIREKQENSAESVFQIQAGTQSDLSCWKNPLLLPHHFEKWCVKCQLYHHPCVLLYNKSALLYWDHQEVLSVKLRCSNIRWNNICNIVLKYVQIKQLEKKCIVNEWLVQLYWYILVHNESSCKFFF